jgi:glyoxylase-like metal-dependent hydrolase (beta-lactamase superfamily II)
MAYRTALLNRRGIIRLGAAAAASAALPALASVTASAEGGKQVENTPPHGNGFYRFKIGDFQATVISDGFGSNTPVGPLFAPNVPPAELEAVLKANFMPATAQGTVNTLVVDTGRERILLDSGWGEKFGPAFGNYAKLEANLQRAGISLDSIDLVVLTHGHLDHIGGLVTKAGFPAFAKATFVFVDTEWNYWTGDRVESDVMRATMPDPFKRAIMAAAKENLPPVAARSRFVKQDGEITSGVRYVAAPGHTPSHAAVHFSSGNAQFLFMADVAHNPVTGLQHPEWKPVFDTDPDLAVKTRKAIFDRVATDRLMVMATHFAFPAVGYVVKHEQAFRWEPARWTW